MVVLLERLDEQYRGQRIRLEIVLQRVIALEQLLLLTVAIIAIAFMCTSLRGDSERKRESYRARERAGRALLSHFHLLSRYPAPALNCTLPQISLGRRPTVRAFVFFLLQRGDQYRCVISQL